MKQFYIEFANVLLEDTFNTPLYNMVGNRILKIAKTIFIDHTKLYEKLSKNTYDAHKVKWNKDSYKSTADHLKSGYSLGSDFEWALRPNGRTTGIWKEIVKLKISDPLTRNKYFILTEQIAKTLITLINIGLSNHKNPDDRFVIVAENTVSLINDVLLNMEKKSPADYQKTLIGILKNSLKAFDKPEDKKIINGLLVIISGTRKKMTRQQIFNLEKPHNWFGNEMVVKFKNVKIGFVVVDKGEKWAYLIVPYNGAKEIDYEKGLTDKITGKTYWVPLGCVPSYGIGDPKWSGKLAFSVRWPEYYEYGKNKNIKKAIKTLKNEGPVEYMEMAVADIDVYIYYDKDEHERSYAPMMYHLKNIRIKNPSKTVFTNEINIPAVKMAHDWIEYAIDKDDFNFSYYDFTK